VRNLSCFFPHYLFYFQGALCDSHSNFLPPGTPPTLLPPKSSNDWTLFLSCVGFELAELLYRKACLSQSNINELLSIWAVTLVLHCGFPPITDHQDLHAQINAIKLGPSHGSHILCGTHGFTPKMVQYQSGWTPTINSGTTTLGRQYTTSSQTENLPQRLIMFPATISITRPVSTTTS